MPKTIRLISWLVIAGFVIHFTIKDGFYWSSLIFYAFPLPVISLLGFFCVLFLKKYLKALMLIISVSCFLIWISRSYIINEISEEDELDNLEILFWNAQHSKGLKEAFSANSSVPELCVLVECNMESIKYAEQNFPNSYFYLSE